MTNETKPTISASELLADTRRLLDARRGLWRTISNKTGVDYHFITRVCNGRIADPGVTRLEKLHSYMIAN